MRSIWKLILATALALFAAANASATPVSLTSIYWEWKVDHAVATNPADDLQIGDAYIRGTRTLYDLTYTADSTTGSSTSRVRAEMQTNTASDDDSFSLSTLVDLQIFGGIDADVTNGLALAGVRLDRMIVGFEVFEPVIYTGTLALSLGNADYFPGDGAFTTGALLEPGRYFNTSLRLLDISRSAAVGETFALNRSGGFDYDFVRVPAPPAIALMLLGLVPLALRKRRARQ